MGTEDSGEEADDAGHILKRRERPWFRKASALLARFAGSTCSTASFARRAAAAAALRGPWSDIRDDKIRYGEISKASIRLLATDIDGTLLNPQFQISEGDLRALRRAHAAGIEIVLVTGRRHTFALPIAQQLGFDLWLISSNGAVTRSLAGETFHRDLMPAETCRQLCEAMQEFRGNTVLTFDQGNQGRDRAGAPGRARGQHPAMA